MSEHTNGLSITRHAIQTLLHKAFTALPSTICGVLGGQHGVVETIYPYTCADSAKHGQLSGLAGMELIALYVSSTSHEESVSALRNRLLRRMSEMDTDISARLHPLPLLIVRLDTKGRMEAVLFGDTPAGVIELPLILQEDEHTIPHAA